MARIGPIAVQTSFAWVPKTQLRGVGGLLPANWALIEKTRQQAIATAAESKAPNWRPVIDRIEKTSRIVQ